MSDALRLLKEKLCRELTQAELDAHRHTTREANKLGDIEPSRRFLAIAAHAVHLRPRWDQLVRGPQPLGWSIAHVVGEVFSVARHFAVDRILSTERSYRGTLLGLHHGLDVAYLLRDVASRLGHARLHRFCDDLVSERAVLVREAEAALVWFADHPDVAMTSGARMLLRTGKERRELALRGA